jgi:hypothetical protein
MSRTRGWPTTHIPVQTMPCVELRAALPTPDRMTIRHGGRVVASVATMCDGYIALKELYGWRMIMQQ